jgi:hypothetical protein
MLGHHKWQIALIYSDDTIIHSKTFDPHAKGVNANLRLVIKSSP